MTLLRALVWVELFLPEDNKRIHVLAYFVPASIAILAAFAFAFAFAFALSVEVILMRKNGENSEGDGAGEHA